VTPSILAKPIESQPAEITQLFFSQPLKGWFEETLPGHSVPDHDVMVVNFDADLYSSTKTVLGFLKDQVRVGAYLYFDEFNDRHHELRAFDEFLKETGMKFKAVGSDQILSHVIFQRIECAPF
jgi:Macrocin-O-methyltransferase (TylF)